MKRTHPNLKSIQHWMQAVIMHPDGTMPGILSQNAQHQIELTPDDLESVITKSSSLTAAERLAIYGRSYHTRLTECLQAEFAVLREALGEELFDLFCRAYLSNCPSQSYTLDDLGKDFPNFLEDTRDDPADEGQQEQWPNFIIDLARLERCFSEVFDEPGVEGQQLPIAQDMGTLSEQRCEKMILIPVICLRLLAFRFPVHDYFHAIRRQITTELLSANDSFIAMYRKDYVVRTIELTLTEYQFLDALMQGKTVNNSLLHAGIASPVQRTQLLCRLEQWCDQGFFSKIHC